MDIDSDSDCDSDGQSQSAITDSQTLTQQQQLGDDSQQVRPQIIVTPRKVAAAITDSIASILAKNNKTTLSECVAAPSNMLLPNSFVFEVNSGASTSSGSVCAEGSVSSMMAQGGSSASGSPSKSVIVRAGPSVSSIFMSGSLKKYLIWMLDTEFTNRILLNFTLCSHRIKIYFLMIA